MYVVLVPTWKVLPVEGSISAASVLRKETGLVTNADGCTHEEILRTPPLQEILQVTKLQSAKYLVFPLPRTIG